LPISVAPIASGNAAQVKSEGVENPAMGGDMRLETARLRLDFDALTMRYAVRDKLTGEILLRDAKIGSDATRLGALGSLLAVSTGRMESGIGEMVQLRLELRGEDEVNLIWEAALVMDQPVLCLRVGMRNLSSAPVRMRQAWPCRDGWFLPDLISETTVGLTLDGQAGAGSNRVEPGLSRESPNNLLLFLPELSRGLVAGGMTYRDFAKYAATTTGSGNRGVQVTLESRDPVGRLVDPGEYYLAEDWFYLDLLGSCPFEALEQYAHTVRLVNQAAPCPYTFPTVCGWYASMPGYGAGRWINDTAGLVEELDEAARLGFLRYTRVGVRLVPDIYEGTSSRYKDPREAGLDPRIFSADRNTEQGWWDDEHWQRFGHYTAPYETSAKWASAVRERGGVPITYVQTGHVSYDYAKKFHGHMLRNDITELDRIFIGHHPYVKYDYTDPEFRSHLREVWDRLGRGGVQGVFFDYPDQAWIETGGFEDPKATTTSAYRGVFDLVKPALGPETFIQERNVSRRFPYLDVTIGLVDSQRVWGDTDGVDPEMFRMCALRWYKTRTLYTYDTDAKNLLKVADRGRDALRQVLTMLYLTTGRILLANSFRVLSPEIIHDLSRLFPTHSEPFTPRPLDAFTGVEIPRIYDLRLTMDWHQVTLFNPSPAEAYPIDFALAGRATDGAVGLESAAEYHVWDFWNDRSIGVVHGGDRLQQTLRPSEARMLSIRRRLAHPQVVSTDRHLLQGWVELSDIVWDDTAQTLRGRWCSVSAEATGITLAANGRRAVVATCAGGNARLQPIASGVESYTRVILEADTGGWLDWSVRFE
jgi:hypothetical protein